MYQYTPNETESIVAYYGDGSTKEYFYNAEEDEFVCNDGSVVRRPTFVSDQWRDHWSFGEHEFLIKVFGKVLEVPVKIIDGSIASIEYTPVEPLVYYEGEYYYSYYERGEGEIIKNYYYRFPETAGDCFTVTYKDGSTKDYVYNNWDGFIAEDGEKIEPSIWPGGPNWEVGEHCFEVSYCGATYELPVTIIPSPVVKIEYDLNNKVIPENTCGYYDSFHCEFDNEFIYTPRSKGDVLTVYYDDGTVKSYKKQGNSAANGYWDDYVSDDGEKLNDRYDIWCFENSMQERFPWHVGTGNTYTISYAGQSVSFDIEITPNPVVDVEYKRDFDVVYEQNTHGWYQDMSIVDNFYMYQYTPNETESIVAYYEDGSTKEYFYNAEKELFVCNDGSVIKAEFVSDQGFDHWSFGEHEFLIKVFDKVLEVPVKIIDGSIASIEYTPVEPLFYYDGEYYYTYYEGANGAIESEYYYEYQSREGDSITITNKNGTSEVWLYDKYSGEFINEDGDTIHPDISSQANWGVGEHSFEVSYNGATCKIPVTITPSPVERIEYDLKNTVFLEHAGGRYDPIGEDLAIVFSDEFIYSPRRKGDVLTVYYTDGSVKSYIKQTNDFDTSGHWDDYVSKDGEKLGDRYKISAYEDWRQKACQFEVGTGNTYYINYAGQRLSFDIEILPNPVVRAEFRRNSEITYQQYTHGEYFARSLVDKFYNYEYRPYYRYEYYPEENDSIIAYYKDGSTKEYFYNSAENEFVCDDGSFLCFDTRDDQPMNHWGVGQHKFYSKMLGTKFEIPVNIVADGKNMQIENSLYYCRYNNSETICLSPQEVLDKWSTDYLNKAPNLRDDSYYLDVVPDGVINAKDYAMLVKLNN